MLKRLSLAALLLWLALLPLHAPAFATVDNAQCSTSDLAGAACSVTHLRTSGTEEIGATNKRSPIALSSVAGTDDYTATAASANSAVITTLTNGQPFIFKPSATNTTTVRLNIDSIGLKAVVSQAGAALSAGDLRSDTIYLIIYYAANDEFRSVTTLGTGAALASSAYVTVGNTGSLSAERAITAGTGIAATDGGANSTYTLALDYSYTIGGNPALNANECVFSTSGSAGGFVCEGTVADTFEGKFKFPDVTGSDQTHTFLTDLSLVGGSGIDNNSGTLDLDATEINSIVWGSGTFTTQRFDAGATDLVWTYSSPASVDITGEGTAPFVSIGDQGSLAFREEAANGFNWLRFLAPAAVTSDRTCTFEDDASFIPDSCVGDGSDGDAGTTDAELAALAGLTSAADKLPYFTGSGTAAVADLSSFIRTLIDDANAGSALTTLGLTANGQSLVTAANYAAMRGLLDLEAGTDFYSIAAADAAFQPLDADLTAVAGVATTAAGRSVLAVADPGADRVAAWDDSAGSFAAIALADLTSEPAPASGDYILAYGAEGDLRKVDWADLPGAGGGISNVSEDASPTLGGHLEGNSFTAGTAASPLEDVHIEEGGDINWDNGDAVLNQTGNVVSLTGASLSLAEGQLAFPASQNASAGANTLDDYEEGTFTPSLTFGGGSTGLTYNFRGGKYTKVGNLVWVNIDFQLSAKGSSTGGASVSGLPFTNGATAGSIGTVVSFTMSTLTDGVQGLLSASSSSVDIYGGGASGSAQLTHANFNNTSRIILSIVYSLS